MAAIFAAPAFTAAHADRAITFGTYSPDKPSSMVRQLRPLLQWIESHASKTLDEKVEIRIQVVRGYKQGVSLITGGKVDFARLGPASYVIAKDENAGLSIIAMEKKRGRTIFNGVIAVHNDSPYRTLQDLRNTVFGFGNEQSTLGRFFAQLYLADAGIHAGDLKSFNYLGRHDKVGQAVGSKLVDAGALEETTFQKLVKAGVPIRAIARMPNATRPWVARAGINPKVFKALRSALIALDNSEIEKKFRFEGFGLGSDEDYKETRRAIRENDRFFNGPALMPTGATLR